jgi:hypothetical protein
MAATVRYEFKGYERVKNSLRRLASDYREETDGTLKAWTKEQQAGMKGFGYPSQTNASQPFKTERQRKWFFAALADGTISVPYRRTGRLANSWLARQEGWSHWVLENSAPYAHWVVGRGQQAVFHEGNWWTADDIIEEEVGDLTEQLTEELVELAK